MVQREAERNALRQRHALLTPREHQVMALVVRGLLNKQIGCELGISEITVKAHRGRVMEKMAAESLPDLVNMAAGLGLAPADIPWGEWEVHAVFVGLMLLTSGQLEEVLVTAQRRSMRTPSASPWR